MEIRPIKSNAKQSPTTEHQKKEKKEEKDKKSSQSKSNQNNQNQQQNYRIGKVKKSSPQLKTAQFITMFIKVDFLFIKKSLLCGNFQY